MGKPNSSVTTAVSIRIPNDLLQAVSDYALSHGFINESGRMDKRGQPNLSAAISDLLKSALELSDRELSSTQSEIPAEDQDIEAKMTAIAKHCAEEAIANVVSANVCDAIVQRLDELLGNYNAEIRKPEIPNSSTHQVSKHKEETKERILSAASRGFRTRGYSGIGVDGLAKEAGVTSGAFYSHFRSKEEAFLAAVVLGLDEYRAGIEKFRANEGENWTVALADYYLGRKHRQDLACGCALPTLSPEVVRSSDSRVRSAYQTGLLRLAETVATGLSSGNEIEKRKNAWVLLSLLAGGVTLARAVWDEAVAEEISIAVRDAVMTFGGS